MKIHALKPILALLLMGSFFLTACTKEESSTVDQDKIFTDLELYYDEAADKTYAYATFKFSNLLGTNLKLTSPSQVSFNGDVLTFNETLARYEKQYAGKKLTGVFSWSDTQGKTFKNTATIAPIGFPASLDSISQAGAYELFWTGDSLREKQNVTLLINGKFEADAQTFLQFNVKSTSLVLDKDKLASLAKGQATMYMDRRFEPTISEATSAGGRVSGRYRPSPKVVIIY